MRNTYTHNTIIQIIQYVTIRLFLVLSAVDFVECWCPRVQILNMKYSTIQLQLMCLRNAEQEWMTRLRRKRGQKLHICTAFLTGKKESGQSTSIGWLIWEHENMDHTHLKRSAGCAANRCPVGNRGLGYWNHHTGANKLGTNYKYIGFRTWGNLLENQAAVNCTKLIVAFEHTCKKKARKEPHKSHKSSEASLNTTWIHWY